ncbi:hypothetical protein V4U86_18920 [Mycobacterium sp. AMU20-3851]|uniref:hypothetical protein n=1 Tax=Mycobacterium sp. AMU20-3851 TaxID=3122055 RepID=UPI0037549EAF
MEPFLGSEALARGTMTRGVLRARYTADLPNIYLPKDTEPTLLDRAKAAWLWSKKSGIIAGRTAAGFYRDPWQISSDPVDLIARNSRHPPGIVLHNERICVDEITYRHGLPITTPVRTALDLARHLPRDEAVTLLDPLVAATGISREDIWQLAKRYRGMRDVRTADAAILDIDPGARTPEQTRVRLLLSDNGFRPTHSQIRVTDGFKEVLLAMGWPALKIGVDCDLADAPTTYIVATSEFLRSQGWLYVPVLPQHADSVISHRVRNAVWSRLRRR